MEAETLVDYGFEQGCSDVHLAPGEAVVFRKNGSLCRSRQSFSVAEMNLFFEKLTGTSLERRAFNLDCSGETPRGVRYRAHFYSAGGAPAAAVRIFFKEIPSMETLGIPEILKKQIWADRGLVLVCGATGSGKSTTLAAMVDAINREQDRHIITIEDPVEYRHGHRRSLVHQRQLGRDVVSFSEGLKAALREDPDVILVGEMRDRETMLAAMTAAETGHLVLTTLHTDGAARAIDRILDSFSGEHRGWVQSQLAAVFSVAAAQWLIPDRNGKRMAVFEVLAATEGVKILIRGGKTHLLTAQMQTGGQVGMFTLAQALERLTAQGKSL